MEKQDRVYEALLALGAENLRAYRQAKLESPRSGRAARDKQLQAALLYHAICQTAEFMGICSYDEFDREIRRLTPPKDGPLPAHGSERGERFH